MEKCPCGSGLAYTACCEPFIKGTKDAPTAETLMRARYTSYVERDERDEVSIEETRKWSQESTWLGLKIVSTKKGGAADDTGIVDFIASYSSKGLKEEYHEVAEFKKNNGQWFYDKGTVVPTRIVRDTPKVGRNDPCPCGSGKKYKVCHGKS